MDIVQFNTVQSKLYLILYGLVHLLSFFLQVGRVLVASVGKQREEMRSKTEENKSSLY